MKYQVPIDATSVRVARRREPGVGAVVHVVGNDRKATGCAVY